MDPAEEEEQSAEARGEAAEARGGAAVERGDAPEDVQPVRTTRSGMAGLSRPLRAPSRASAKEVDGIQKSDSCPGDEKSPPANSE